MARPGAQSKATRVSVPGLLLILAGIMGAGAYQLWQTRSDRASVESGAAGKAGFTEQRRIYGTVPEFSLVERSRHLRPAVKKLLAEQDGHR